MPSGAHSDIEKSEEVNLQTWLVRLLDSGLNASSLIRMIVLCYSACFAVHPDWADVDESYKRYESGEVIKLRDSSTVIRNCISFIDFD